MLGPWHGTWMNSVLNLPTRMQFAQRVCQSLFKGLINVDCQQFHEHHELYILMLHILTLANWHDIIFFHALWPTPFIDIFFLASRCYWGTKICSQSNNRPIASSGFGRPRALLASLIDASIIMVTNQHLEVPQPKAAFLAVTKASETKITPKVYVSDFSWWFYWEA